MRLLQLPKPRPRVRRSQRLPRCSTDWQVSKGSTPPWSIQLITLPCEDTYLEGPFTVLRRCFLERKRVMVVIRRVNSVRGTCMGFLKAFDKHMNLLLMDVTEVSIAHETHEKQLRDMRSGALPPSAGMFSVADPRRNRRFTQQTYAKQLFIRGDNVVMVCDEDERQQQRHAQHQRRESSSSTVSARPVSGG